MPILIIIGLGGALSGWSILLILSGERQRRLKDALAAAPPVPTAAPPVLTNKN